MLLFVFVFGGAMDFGAYSILNFIVPGVILQVLCQASGSTAVGVTTDMKKGMIDRFRSMAISKSAFLNGHVLAAVVRNSITTVLIIAVSVLIGFRPAAGFLDWLAAIGMLLLLILTLSWVAMIIGLTSNNPEDASGITSLGAVIPYLSSGFVPTDTMPWAVRIFAENQPMTPIINTLRSLMLGRGPGDDLWLAIAWCVGILIVTYVISLNIYKRKLTK